MDPDQPRRPGRPKRRQLNINDDPPVAGSSTGEAAAAAGINVVRSGNESGLQPKPGRTHHLEAALSKFIEGDPEKYQKLLEDIQEAVKEVIERGSPLTRAKYASAKLSFEVTVKLLTPNVQPPLDPWARSVVNRYAEEYLEFRATVVRGRQGENVKAIAVCGWYASLVVVIARNAYDPATGQKCGGVLLYREGLCKRLEDRVYTIIQQKKLVQFSRRRARRTFGPAEVQTVIEHLVKSSIDRGRLVRIQEWCALIMAMMAATRPGSLCAAHPEYKENKQYLQVGDLHLRLTGPVTYQIEIEIRHLKGSNQTAQGRVVNYLFGPVRLIKNLLFDNWVIVVYLWGRGCLPQYKTLNDLINAKEDELVLSKKEEPFFLSSAPGGTRLIPNEALSSSRLSGNVGNACKASGFPDLAFYDLRKDAANDFERKLGSGAASLHLAHKEAATVVTEHYSLGAGNVNITGVRTGEAVDQFAHGYESRLAMRARDGTALCYISNVIALAGKTDSDDSDEEGGDENDNVERAMEKAKKAREVLVETAVENALRESEEVRKCQAVVEQRWDAWIQTFVPGSDLYMHYKLKSPYMVQTNISEVKKWAQYKAAVEEDAGFKAEVEAAEKALRDAFDSFATKKKFISKVTTRAIKKELDQKQIETHADTYEDKNRAIEYLERPSALVTGAIEAAKTSTSRQGPILQEKPVPEADQPVDRPNVQPSQEQILALNEEDDDLVAEEAVEEYNKLLNYLPAGFRDGVGSRIQKTLNEVQKDIQEQADAEIPDEQPKQEWGDDHDQEEYTGTSLISAKIALIKSVMDPHLFEVECKKRIEEMNGKLTCWKCPEGTGHTFVQFTKLKTHLRQHHTEWIKLSAKIQDQNKFICPGVCGASKQFDSEDKACNHCLSKDCGDQAGFLMLKARHDQIQVERYNMQKKYKRAVSAQGRAAMYVNQVKYFAALDEEDLLELADQHDIRREEITPHVPAMLENFHHAAETVLSAAGQN